MSQPRGAQPRKHVYLKPQRFRVTMYRRYEECGVAQEALSLDYAIRKLWNMYADKFLRTYGAKKKFLLCYRTTRMLIGERIKPTDRVYYIGSQTGFNGVRCKIEVM